MNVCAKCGYGWVVPYTGFAEAELLKQEHERNLLFDRQRQRNEDLRARLALAEKVVEALKTLSWYHVSTDTHVSISSAGWNAVTDALFAYDAETK